MFEEGGAGAGEGGEPGGGHTDALDALACGRRGLVERWNTGEVEWGVDRGWVKRLKGANVPGKKRAVLGRVGVAVDDHLEGEALQSGLRGVGRSGHVAGSARGQLPAMRRLRTGMTDDFKEP